MNNEEAPLVLHELDLHRYVTDMISSLESYVYTKNRIDLYHKEGIGLGIALEEKERDDENYSSLHVDRPVSSEICVSRTSKTISAEQYLKSQDKRTINRQNLYSRLFKSYEDAQQWQQERTLIQNEQPSSGTDSKPDESEGKSSSSIDDEKPSKGSPSSDPSSHALAQSSNTQDFNPSPVSYEIGEEEEEEALKDASWAYKLSYRIRLFLWSNYIDHILFVHLEKMKDGSYHLKTPKLQDFGILRLLEASLLSRSLQIVAILIVVNFIMNDNLISLFIVLSVFCFSILDNPLASSRFWKFLMSYVLTIISLKFLY
jgi:hypothetical protein